MSILPFNPNLYIVDKKTILRSFKDSMILKFGKTAEGTINEKLYHLLKAPNLGEIQLKAAENDIESLLKEKPLNQTISPKRISDKNISLIKRNIK